MFAHIVLLKWLSAKSNDVRGLSLNAQIVCQYIVTCMSVQSACALCALSCDRIERPPAAPWAPAGHSEFSYCTTSKDQSLRERAVLQNGHLKKASVPWAVFLRSFSRRQPAAQSSRGAEIPRRSSGGKFCLCPDFTASENWGLERNIPYVELGAGWGVEEWERSFLWRGEGEHFHCLNYYIFYSFIIIIGDDRTSVEFVKLIFKKNGGHSIWCRGHIYKDKRFHEPWLTSLAPISAVCPFNLKSRSLALKENLTMAEITSMLT